MHLSPDFEKKRGKGSPGDHLGVSTPGILERNKQSKQKGGKNGKKRIRERAALTLRHGGLNGEGVAKKTRSTLAWAVQEGEVLPVRSLERH